MYIYGSADYALLAVGGRRIEKQHRLGAVIDSGGIEGKRRFLIFLRDGDMQRVSAATGISLDTRPCREGGAFQRVPGQPGKGHFHVALKTVILLLGFQRQICAGKADGMILVLVTAIFQKLYTPREQSFITELGTAETCIAQDVHHFLDSVFSKKSDRICRLLLRLVV